jgi:GTPase SAR1 family protein
MVIFDFQNKETFENIRSWLSVIKTKAKIESPTIVILGNKCDVKGA